MSKKLFGAFFLMCGGAIGAYGTLIEQRLFWIVAFILALVGCIAIGIFDGEGVE